ncbi:MAG: TIGR00730 family Rossman fold protein [bacterium]|nr:TIGR00730 family Rossman fold protein [bacterium]
MSRTILSIAVYCGSSPGASPAYGEAAANLGRELAGRGIRLVYGGASVGLMGILADACLQHGGEALGVITEALKSHEVAHDGLTELRVVSTMHERKAVMSDSADAFVMLPGGFGTLDEFFEALTWTQLGVHAKPCGVLDVDGYFEPLREFLDAATAQRFLKPENRRSVIFEDHLARLIERLEAWIPASTDKWIDRDTV